MLKVIKNLLLPNLIFIATAITLAIICLSLFKIPSIGIRINNIDKAYHCIAYFALAFSWLFTFYKKPEKKYMIIFCCIIFGIIIELLQNNLTDYRTGDYLDALANSFGVILAFFIFNIFSKKMKPINEKKL